MTGRAVTARYRGEVVIEGWIEDQVFTSNVIRGSFLDQLHAPGIRLPVVKEMEDAGVHTLVLRILKDNKSAESSPIFTLRASFADFKRYATDTKRYDPEGRMYLSSRYWTLVQGAVPKNWGLLPPKTE